MDYKTSGVDIIKGRSFVEYIKALAPNIGGFNGMMEFHQDMRNLYLYLVLMVWELKLTFVGLLLITPLLVRTLLLCASMTLYVLVLNHYIF